MRVRTQRACEFYAQTDRDTYTAAFIAVSDGTTSLSSHVRKLKFCSTQCCSLAYVKRGEQSIGLWIFGAVAEVKEECILFLYPLPQTCQQVTPDPLSPV